MNDIDKRWYEHLKVLSKIPVNKPYDKYKVEVTKEFGKYMEGETWNELHKLGYINTSPSTTQIVTEKGMEMLRLLEGMYNEELDKIERSQLLAIQRNQQAFNILIGFSTMITAFIGILEVLHLYDLHLSLLNWSLVILIIICLFFLISTLIRSMFNLSK